MNLLGFAAAVLVIELTPGPNMAWLAGLTLAKGRRVGFAAVAGVAIGLILNALVAAFGVVTLLTEADWLWDALRYGGGLFMLFLAWEAWRDPGSSSTARPASAAASGRRAMRSGIVVNLLNPKAFLFYAAVAPQFLGGRLPSLPEMAVLAAISIGIATLVHVGIILFAGQAHGWVTSHHRTRLIRRLLAAAMVGVAIWFVTGS